MVRRISHVQPIKPRTRPEHAAGMGDIGVFFGPFLHTLGQCHGGGLEQLRKAGEHIAEQAGHAQRHIDTRTAQHHRGQYLEARYPLAGLIPARGDTGQMQRHGEFLARRAHGGRSPQVQHQPLWPVAMVLHMAAQQFLGKADALCMGHAAGDGTRVDAEQVAAGGQNVAAPTVG
jgi:hypothetical protein